MSTRFNIRLLTSTLFIFCCTTAATAYSQEHSYSFKIEGVTTAGGAKVIIDPLRKLFNTQTEPFRTFPVFNDATDTFQFTSNIWVTQEQVDNCLKENGYQLAEFTLVPDKKENHEKD